MLAVEQADELPTGRFGCRQGAHFLQIPRAGEIIRRHAEFLGQFASGRAQVILAMVQVPGRAGIPRSGMPVFPGGTLLQEQFSVPVDHEQMDRAVAQTLRVDDAARFDRDHPIPLVHDVEAFTFGILRGFDVDRTNDVRQVDPLVQTEFLAPHGLGNSELPRDRRPGMRCVPRHGIAQ